jgi:hypothetical protein
MTGNARYFAKASQLRSDIHRCNRLSICKNEQLITGRLNRTSMRKILFDLAIQRLLQQIDKSLSIAFALNKQRFVGQRYVSKTD